MTLDAQVHTNPVLLSERSLPARPSILMGSHPPGPSAAAPGPGQLPTHSPGHTLPGSPTPSGAPAGGVTGRAGAPPGACWQAACVTARQETTRRQHGPRGNPRRAPRQRVTQWRWPASCPSAGTQGAGLQEAAQPLHRHGHRRPPVSFLVLQTPRGRKGRQSPHLAGPRTTARRT